MSGIQDTPFKGIGELIVGSDIFNNNSQFGTVKEIHHLMNAGIDCLLEETLYRSDVQSQVRGCKVSSEAQNSSDSLSRDRLCSICPLDYPSLTDDNFKCLPGNISILLITVWLCSADRMPLQQRYRRKYYMVQ